MSKLEEAEEEDIEQHFNVERDNLLNNVRVQSRKPSCRRNLCKGIVLTIAGILFILMMVQLWGDYGSMISTRAFPPKISSLGSYCKNGTSPQPSYQPLKCSFEGDVLECETTENVFVQACPPSMVTRESGRIRIEPYVTHNVNSCIDLVTYSV